MFVIFSFPFDADRPPVCIANIANRLLRISHRVRFRPQSPAPALNNLHKKKTLAAMDARQVARFAHDAIAEVPAALV
jgi:hypothetical protein